MLDVMLADVRVCLVAEGRGGGDAAEVVTRPLWMMLAGVMYGLKEEEAEDSR